jgi:ADP-sugar diphosphatase
MTVNSFLKKSEHIPDDHYDFALTSRIFVEWLRSLEIPIESCTVDAVDFRGKHSAETVMFVRLKVRTKGKPYDQIVQLRGNSVAMLIILSCEEERYVVLAEQLRLATGKSMLEIPAGMIDNGTFSGAAAKEIEEETGLAVSAIDMVRLSRDPIYMSPGMQDEAIHFYLVEKKIEKKEMAALINKKTGAADEHESIVVTIEPLRNLEYNAGVDAKTHIALNLYRQMCEWGPPEQN